jgi:hypothetical protein
VSGFFDRLEGELVAAAERRVGRRLRLGAPLALAGAVVVAGGALAATGQIELGNPDPPARHSAGAAERGIGVPPPGRGRLLAVRAPDPKGGPPWGIRVFRSSRDYPCAQYGRVVDGRLVRIGRDGKAHELALHCRGHSNPGSFGNTGRLYYGYVGPRARRVIFEGPGRRRELAVRDGAYLFVVARPRREQPRITVVLDDGSRHLQSPGAPPIPGTLTSPPDPPGTAAIKGARVRTSAREISPDGSVVVTFRAPLAIRDAHSFYRVEANGPHARDCAGRVLAATDRNYDRGDTVRLRLERPNRIPSREPVPWCRGSFRGRVSFNLRATVGTFRLTVR